jgi:hypothetical protein
MHTYIIAGQLSMQLQSGPMQIVHPLFEVTRVTSCRWRMLRRCNSINAGLNGGACATHPKNVSNEGHAKYLIDRDRLVVQQVLKVQPKQQIFAMNMEYKYILNPGISVSLFD